MGTRVPSLLLLFLLAAPARGDTHTLFTGAGRFHRDYARMLDRLAEGDTVVFSDGTRFQVEGILGRGEYTLVLAVDGGRALRIPRRPNPAYQYVLRDFAQGARAFQEGEPAVRLLGDLDFEYVLVERLDPQYRNLNEFFAAVKDMPEAERRAKWAEFVDFMVDLGRFSFISDLHQGQVVYDRNLGFRLVDWFSLHTVAGHSNSRIVLDYAQFLQDIPPEIRDEIRARTQAAREVRGLVPGVRLLGKCAQGFASLFAFLRPKR